MCPLSQAAAFDRKDLVIVQPWFPFIFIPPDSNFLNGWSMLILILVLIQSFTIPLEACFMLEPIFGRVGDYVILVLFVSPRGF